MILMATQIDRMPRSRPPMSMSMGLLYSRSGSSSRVVSLIGLQYWSWIGGGMVYSLPARSLVG